MLWLAGKILRDMLRGQQGNRQYWHSKLNMAAHGPKQSRGSMTYRFITVAIISGFALLIGCSNDDNSTPSVDWTIGRGTAACHEWQQAYCELAAKCAGLALTDCARQYQGITCNSDTAAANCATALEAATCVSVPSGCGATDLADTAPAIAGCNQLYTDVCTHDANCGSSTTVDSCVSQMQTQASCDNAIGLELNYETCLAKISAATCTASMPTECTDVLVGGS
jgi:hypothetical protein